MRTRAATTTHSQHERHDSHRTSQLNLRGLGGALSLAIALVTMVWAPSLAGAGVKSRTAAIPQVHAAVRAVRFSGHRALLMKSIEISVVTGQQLRVSCDRCQRFRGRITESHPEPGVRLYRGVNWILWPGRAVSVRVYRRGEVGRFMLLGVSLGKKPTLVFKESGCLASLHRVRRCPRGTRTPERGTPVPTAPTIAPNGSSTAPGSSPSSSDYTLTVNTSGSGAISGSGISCSSSCTKEYPSGTQITLSASPATGNSFAGWSGPCSGASSCSFTITSDTAVTATFAVIDETLTIDRSGPSQGSVSGGGISCGGTCSVSVPYGTAITISASWPWDVRFNAWQNGGCAGTGSCTITMTSNVTVGAPFSGYFETAGSSGATTFSDPSNESGVSTRVAAYQTIQVSCWLTGLAVSDGNPYYYRIASSPWNNSYYASGDPFYNNGSTSGGLVGTPFKDNTVPSC